MFFNVNLWGKSYEIKENQRLNSTPSTSNEMPISDIEEVGLDIAQAIELVEDLSLANKSEVWTN